MPAVSRSCCMACAAASLDVRPQRKWWLHANLKHHSASFKLFSDEEGVPKCHVEHLPIVKADSLVCGGVPAPFHKHPGSSSALHPSVDKPDLASFSRHICAA